MNGKKALHHKWIEQRTKRNQPTSGEVVNSLKKCAPLPKCTCAHMHMHPRTHIHMRTYTHTHTHTHAHTRTHAHKFEREGGAPLNET